MSLIYKGGICQQQSVSFNSKSVISNDSMYNRLFFKCYKFNVSCFYGMERLPLKDQKLYFSFNAPIIWTKCSLSPNDPIFLSSFLSPNAPGCENRCPTPKSISYISATPPPARYMVYYQGNLRYIALHGYLTIGRLFWNDLILILQLMPIKRIWRIYPPNATNEM